MTWHSTASYYRLLNEGVVDRLGPYRSADLVLRSIDYGVVRDARLSGDHRGLAKAVLQAARDVHRAGAEGIVLCSNSLHAAEPRVRSELPLPVLHIADALGRAAIAQGHRHLALFGTGFTMRRRFIRERLETMGLELSVPEDIDAIDRIILNDLVRGHVCQDARETFRTQLQPLLDDGATAFVAGCTEIPLLIRKGDVDVPILDTLELHVEQVLNWMTDA